ncbi:MAG: hypothetical protein AAF664_04140 [Planctomycetota bacterium]
MSEIDTAKMSTTGSTINLVRSSHPWTKADSAAGVVLRYLMPMRRLLTDMTGSNELADKSLKVLISHLAASGFGEHKKGRLRDFLLRGLRSACKMAIAELDDKDKVEPNLDLATLDSKAWLVYWRDGLLERAWRSLERYQHSNSHEPVHTLLQLTASEELIDWDLIAAKMNGGVSDTDGEPWLASKLPPINDLARQLFAQFVADEVSETLQDPNAVDVKREIQFLGLNKAFTGMTI